MSFSYSVKKELCSIITDRDRKYACLYGMLLFCRNFSADSIVFQTENDMVCELFCKLADDVLGGSGVASVSKTTRKNSTVLYALSIEDEKYIEIQLYSFCCGIDICRLPDGEQADG